MVDLRARVDELLFASGLSLEFDICHGTNRLPVPQHFQSLLASAITDRKAVSEYGPPEGPRQLRSAIAQWESSANGVAFSAENVLMTHGATEALHLCFLALRARGIGTLLVVGPQFPTVIATAHAAGLKIEQPRGERHLCYRPASEDIANLIRNARPGAICLTLPMNPSGEILGDQDLQRVTEVAASMGTIVVVDKVCGDIASPTMLGPSRYGAIAAASRAEIFLIDAYSKRRSIPGLRVGYVVAPMRDIQCMTQMIVGRTVSTVPAAAILFDIQETLPWIHSRNDDLKPTEYINSVWRNHALTRSNWDYARDRLGSYIAYLSPIDVGINCALSVNLREPQTELDVFEHLLREHAVATYPIGCFMSGAQPELADTFQIRMTCAAPPEEFRAAMDQFASAMERKYFL